MNGEAPQHKRVRRIIRLERGPDGYVPIVLYDARAGRKKKNTTPLLRPMEQLLRQCSDAQSAAALDYLARHRRSSEKRKNGWLHDLGRNVLKSQRRASRRIKVAKIVIP
jgi:hypothetical protein